MMTRNTERDKQIVARRKAGATLHEIGKAFNISRERVRQICWRADRIANRERQASQAILQRSIS